MTICNRPISGVGIGLRSLHYKEIFSNLPNIPWFEVITENFIGRRALPMRHLLQLRQDYPIALHGVSLSIGSTDPLNLDYLRQLKDLANISQPEIISDHLCFSSINQQYVPDLLPLPQTEQVVKHIVERVSRVQDFLGQKILLENVSRYLEFEYSDMAEWQFLTEIANQADCYLLLDINNIMVNMKNLYLSEQPNWAIDYINNIPISRVKQFHLAGFKDCGDYYLDTHGEEVKESVWQLYQHAINRFNDIPALIEWDNDIPPLEILIAQAQKAEEILFETKKSSTAVDV